MDSSIEKLSKLYKKEHLNSYKKCVNEAAYKLALGNPTLLCSRNELFANARKRVHDDGYQFKKRQSRSIQVVPPTESSIAKRQKLDSYTRVQQMLELQSKLNDIEKSIHFKESSCSVSEHARNHKRCDELMEEIRSIKLEKNVLQTELSVLERKNKKSKMVLNEKIIF